jgi:diguanylate cyclase (GGDEF)-like protein/PAS domain S-box-containing protein
VLAALGGALRADRVQLFENYRRADGCLIGKLVGEWCADGIQAAFPGGAGEKIAYGESLLPFGEDLQDHAMHAHAADLAESSKLALEGVSAQFVAATAVRSEDRWWGSIELQYCESDPRWSKLDSEVLDAFASSLGAAIAHRGSEPIAEYYRELVEEIPAILYIDDLSRDFYTIYVGPQIETILGIPRSVWLTEDDAWERNIHPDDWPQMTKQYDEFLASGTDKPLVQEYRMIRPDNGELVWIRDECSAVLAAENTPGVVKGVMYDITEQKKLEEQIRAAEAKRRALIEQIPGIVYVWPMGDSDEEPFVSAAVETVLGCTREQWLNENWWLDHVHEEDRDQVLAARSALDTASEPVEIEYRMRLEGDHVIWVDEVAQVLMRDGKPWVLQGVLGDITKRKEAEEQMAFLAFHDVLTGLPNRAMFDEHLRMAISRAERKACVVAVLYVDLDELKKTNDTIGHFAGDELLRATASRLRAAVRKEDLVARVGGDEFLVMVPDLDPNPRAPGTRMGKVAASPATSLAVSIAKRICAAMRVPVETSAGPVESTASVGISLFPIDADDTSELIHHADEAMYQSKQSGHGAFVIYSEPPIPDGGPAPKS